MLRSILELKFKYMKAYKITNKVSNASIISLTALGSILILYMKNLNIIFVLIYLWYIVIQENRKYKTAKRAYNTIKNNS